MSRWIIVKALAVALLITGCGSLHKQSSFRAIASHPPVAAIELIKPAAVSEEGATTTFPPGKYRPMYEDDHGYYFEAPRKVIVDTTEVEERNGYETMITIADTDDQLNLIACQKHAKNTAGLRCLWRGGKILIRPLTTIRRLSCELRNLGTSGLSFALGNTNE